MVFLLLKGEHNTEIINQAEQYLDFAEVNTCNYKVPKVLFNFSNGITQPLYSALEKHVFLSVSTKITLSK